MARLAGAVALKAAARLAVPQKEPAQRAAVVEAEAERYPSPEVPRLPMLVVEAVVEAAVARAHWRRAQPHL